MRKHKASHDDLIAATGEMASGLIDADLSRHVIKKRVTLQGPWKEFGRKNNCCNPVWASIDLLVWVRKNDPATKSS